MSKKITQLPVCDDHPDEIAQAICKYHKKLLCLSCALEKAKSAVCSLAVISTISDELDNALYKGLIVRQTALNKKRLIETHEYKTKALKNNLKKQITDFYEQLIRSLNKKREDSLSLTEKAADAIIAETHDDKQQLETFEKAIAESLEKLSSEFSCELSGIQTKLHEITNLLNNIPDRASELEGEFEADECLKDIFSKPGLTLGMVYMISHDHYDNVEDQTKREIIYEDTRLERVQHNNPKRLINKTSTIKSMEEYFRSACKFSKIVPIASSCFILLSRAHDSIVLTSIDGHFYAKETVSGLSDIVALGREEIAGIKLVDKNLQVTKYGVRNKKLEPLGDFIINAEVPKITGFDFDTASSKFAVSSPGKVVIFKQVKIEKETAFPIGSTTNTAEVVTIYDFTDDCIYLLDSHNKTLKCFSVFEANYLWKVRIDGQHMPRKMCLFENKLCLTYGKAIAIFNAKDGKPDVRHDTCGLLDDCDGLCVIDGVIVFSSSSREFDTSTKLAFISM